MEIKDLRRVRRGQPSVSLNSAAMLYSAGKLHKFECRTTTKYYHELYKRIEPPAADQMICTAAHASN